MKILRLNKVRVTLPYDKKDKKRCLSIIVERIEVSEYTAKWRDPGWTGWLRKLCHIDNAVYLLSGFAGLLISLPSSHDTLIGKSLILFLFFKFYLIF